jgi:hypothetical protein
MFAFGFKLAELLKQNEASALGLLSLAIKDARKSPQRMDFQNFKFQSADK